jgi:hypothetical protein
LRCQPSVFGAASNGTARRDQGDMWMLVAQRERPDRWWNAEVPQSAAALDSTGTAICLCATVVVVSSAASASACGRIFIRIQ